MRTWIWLLKARALLLCSAVVVIVGLAPVLYLVGLVAWQFDIRLETGSWIALPAALAFTDRALLHGGSVAPVLVFIPHLNWLWTPNEQLAQVLRMLHIGVVPGLIGCAMVATGISGVLRQKVLVRIHKERKKNPVQPAEHYRREASIVDPGHGAGRSEPFIGAEDSASSAANDTAAPPRAAGPVAEPLGGRPKPAGNPAPCRRARGRPMRRQAAA